MDLYSLLILFVTVLLCVFLTKLFWKRGVSADGKTFPGPTQLPLIGNAFDVDFRLLHLSLSDMAEKYGDMFSINLLGQQAVVIYDVELEKKAFGSAEYGDNFNDRADSFWGKYVCFDCSDIAFANATKRTMAKRKMLHRSLKFYGDGIEHFERLNEDELLQFLENLKMTKQQDFNMYNIVSKSFSNTLVRLLIGKAPESQDSKTIMEYADIADYFFSGMAFVYEFMPLIRFLPGNVGNLYRRAIASRDYILDRCYFPVRDHADNSTGPYAHGLVKNLIRLRNEMNQSTGAEFITENDVKGVTAEIIEASQGITSNMLKLHSL